VTLGEFQHAIEEWIPAATAWKGDNVGIQIGRPDAKISNILVALDATLDVSREARARKANLIITHHPLLFQPLRSVTPNSRAGEIALYLAEHKINLYSAHTNLDHVDGGVSYALASLLGLKEVRILSPLTETLVKVAVFVPTSHLEKVAQAMHDAGGGKFTKYQECSFRTEGIGTFRGSDDAKPFIGTRGVLSRTPEVKLEMLVETWNLRSVIEAMVKTHPYEELAYDVYQLANKSRTFGLGAIGELLNPTSVREVLSLVKRKLGSASLRYTGKTSRRVKRIAVCGGGGSELLPEAVKQHADAFITADVKYHGFQGAERDICLIDAGHFETERHVLPVLAKRVNAILRGKKSSSKIFITTTNTNPISYF
jgi:dinuclear metal center YbgI/SA1388 family protein